MEDEDFLEYDPEDDDEFLIECDFEDELICPRCKNSIYLSEDEFYCICDVCGYEITEEDIYS